MLLGLLFSIAAYPATTKIIVAVAVSFGNKK
jgi:hypothetical protein